MPQTPNPNSNSNPNPNLDPSYYSSAGNDDDDNVSEKTNPVSLTAALICFGWLLLGLSLGLYFTARAERKKMPSFRQYSDIKSCISFFEDLSNGRGVFATRHTDEFKEMVDGEKFEEIKSDVSEVITKATFSATEKFQLWIRRRKESEKAEGKDDSLEICGHKKIELIGKTFT